MGVCVLSRQFNWEIHSRVFVVVIATRPFDLVVSSAIHSFFRVWDPESWSGGIEMRIVYCIEFYFHIQLEFVTKQDRRDI